MSSFLIFPLSLFLLTSPSISDGRPSHKKLTDHDIRSNFNDVQTGMGVLLRELLSVMDDNEKLSEHVRNTNRHFSVLKDHNKNTSHVIRGMKRLLKSTKKSIHHLEHKLLRNLTRSQQKMKVQLTKFVTNKYAFLAWMVYKLESQNKEQEQMIGDLKTENSAQQAKTRRLENKLKSLQRRLERCEENMSRNQMLMEQRSLEVGNLRNSVSMILKTLESKKKKVVVPSTHAQAETDAVMNRDEEDIDDLNSKVDGVNETVYSKGNRNTLTREISGTASQRDEDDTAEAKMVGSEYELSPDDAEQNIDKSDDQKDRNYSNTEVNDDEISNSTGTPDAPRKHNGRIENRQKELATVNQRIIQTKDTVVRDQNKHIDRDPNEENNSTRNEQSITNQKALFRRDQNKQSNRGQTNSDDRNTESEINRGKTEQDNRDQKDPDDRGNNEQINRGHNEQGNRGNKDKDGQVDRGQNEPLNHRPNEAVSNGDRSEELDDKGAPTTGDIDNSKMKTRTRSV